MASTLTLLTGVLPLTAAVAQQTDMQPPQPLASPTTKPAPNPMIQPVNRAVVAGNVTYLARIALPPNAVVKVSLQDVSRADVAAIGLDEQTISTNGKQVPIPFTLKYDPSRIKPNHSYAVSARILIDGKLAWISTTRNSVITQGNPTRDVTVLVQQVPRR